MFKQPIPNKGTAARLTLWNFSNDSALAMEGKRRKRKSKTRRRLFLDYALSEIELHTCKDQIVADSQRNLLSSINQPYPILTGPYEVRWARN
jgi:hypothetical protein